jgi:hypothetical protein
MDDWDLYDEEPVQSTSAAAVKRNHVVFTDSLDAGALVTLLRSGRHRGLTDVPT